MEQQMKYPLAILLALTLCSTACYAQIKSDSASTNKTVYPSTITLGQIQTSKIQQQVLDFLTPIYGNLGIELKTMSLPSKRALTLSNTGKLDGELLRVPGITDTYPDLIAVPITLYQMRVFAYTIEGKKTFNNASDVLHFNVGIHRGVHWEESFVSQFPHHVSRVGSTMQKFKLLTLGRVDYILSSEQRAQKVIKKDYPSQNIVKVSPMLGEINLIHYLHKKHAHIIPSLMNEIEKHQRLLPLVHQL